MGNRKKREREVASELRRIKREEEAAAARAMAVSCICKKTHELSGSVGFLSVCAMRLHNSEFHGECKFECPVCVNVFRTELDLFQHRNEDGNVLCAIKKKPL